jgi:hypothetical protein
VAAGDLDGDGFADLVAGGGPGGGPRVTAFAGRELVASGGAETLADFFAGDPADRGGVRVAVGGVGSLVAAGPGGAVAAYTLGGVPSAPVGDGEFIAAVAPPPPVPPAPLPPPIVPTIPPPVETPFPPPPTPVPPPPVPPGRVPPPATPPASQTPDVFEDADWAYYVPSGITAGHDYPVLFAFSPAADPHEYDAVLWPLAERQKWVVAGSKLYHNGDPRLSASFTADQQIDELGPGYPDLRDAVTRGLGAVPGDSSRVILFGTSGGAPVSHAMSLAYPGLADALIINTGMIWGDTIIGLNPGETGTSNGPDWNRHLDANGPELTRAFADAGSRRLAAFLQSPTDFRYEEMLADADRLRAAGWDVDQLTFASGPSTAPAAVIEQAAEWIASHPDWQ